MVTEGLPKVTQKFLEEEAVSKSIIKKKKGGPYLKHEREKRRAEVFKLHFKFGVSAVGIASTLDVNRNTILNDINYWYQKMSKQWENMDYDSWMMKQMYRMEAQRTTLLQDLKKTYNLWESMAVHKLVHSIDSKIAQITIRTSEAQRKERETSVKELNALLDEHDKKESLPRFARQNEVFKVSQKTRKKIEELILSDRKNHLGKW